MQLVRQTTILQLIFLAVMASFCAAQTETWKIDPAHSAVQFSVRHMGISTVRGQFPDAVRTGGSR